MPIEHGGYYDEHGHGEWRREPGITRASSSLRYVVFDVNLPRDAVAAFADATDAVNYLNASANPNLAMRLNK